MMSETKAPEHPPAYQPSAPAPAGTAPSYGTVAQGQGQPQVHVVYQQVPMMPGFGTSFDQQRVQERTVKYLRLVPAMNIVLAIIWFMFNCIIPGIGTLLACFFLPCSNTVVKGDSMIKILCVTFAFGLLQLITCPIVVGYFLAIIWSYGTIFANRLYYQNPLDENEIQPLVTRM